MKSYRVVYERDESGHWIATVRGVAGCHSYGRSISEARARVREALGLFVRGRVRLEEDVRLPAEMRRHVRRFRAARERAERERAHAVAAVQALTRELSRRDAAELLGVSHQRVDQLAREA
jgi:predicted RNase H-like HicB family nuclease